MTNSSKLTRAPVLINATEVAELMQISERTLWRLLSSGKFIEPVRIGGSTRWQIQTVEKWIAAGCPSPEDFQE